ncbi:ATP-binding protein [Roseospira visakhapatnamensis]|uniref:Anti-sigma regulatory factor (Ser/Thr protein kinase) n=1 Tax=Roseospira visakhapatnamensis TaxID=390880 RepID=A0A7W6REK4_9PROT|nr:ATP-binding protein [Roseospira visakhapatnamensis]MBB4266594.1 anti-sigma regulatory factor (Ser/Thr protein kinase) [Roseospira visakhapatnamensis]
MGRRYVVRCDFTSVADTWERILPNLTGYSQDDLIKIHIGLVEILNNIVEHSYGGECDRTFTLSVFRISGGLVFVADHDGPRFLDEPPARALHSPRVWMSTEERGRGLWLIDQCFNSVAYRRRRKIKRVIASYRSSPDPDRDPDPDMDGSARASP